MGSNSLTNEKPHAVCVPYPAQGHINPMLKLAKILHFKGLHITFVNTEFNHRRLLKSRGPDALNGLPSFRFETIPDGLPPSDAGATQDIPALNESITNTCIGPFRELLKKLNDANSSEIPPVSCIVSDGVLMTFTLEAADELGLPQVLLWTASACGYLGCMQYPQLIEKGLIPLKDESYLTDGYLEQTLDWIPGMEDIRLRDLPSFIRTTNPDDLMIKSVIQQTSRAKKASAVVLNTFEKLEHEAIEALKAFLPAIYTLGPLQFLEEMVDDESLAFLGSNLWKEEKECLDWLSTKDPNSVVYVNYGSLMVMTPDQLVEFAWGLANSKQTFLWIIRPDLVSGDSAVLPPDFLEETNNRGMLASWCPQEQVLEHPSIGGFLTHCGWNSTLESIGSGVSMICWPFFADQQTNCWYCCTKWGIGIEIDNNVKRDEVERFVTKLMVGEKEKKMKKNVLEWKSMGEEAAKSPNGSSLTNLEMVIKVLLQSNFDISITYS